MSLNIKLNKRIQELSQVDDLFICMAGGDESLCIGAAQYLYSQQAHPSNLQALATPYLGPGYKKEELSCFFDDPFIKQNYEIFERVDYEQLAEILAGGDVIALFTKQMEFGPRALGHRSIIADPRNIKVVKIINSAIKNRDFWMPFTPSILEERAEDYLVNPKNLAAPYMTIAFDSTKLGRRDLAAAVHPL